MAGRARVLLSHTTDPWFNLATEDWIFRTLDPATHVLFLWRNEPTVVIGKHQNPWIECDVRRMERDGVRLARRQSGGGTVYHDPGNTNFTFLAGTDLYDVDSNFDIILAALASLGIDAERTERNDILVGDRKVSGNAFKHVKDRSFHHGTLLVDADLDRLTRYLNPARRDLVSKGIKSVRSRVANLSDHVHGLDHERLWRALQDAFCAFHRERPKPEILDRRTLAEVPELLEYYEKISAWEWQFGLTPDFTQRLHGHIGWGSIELEVNVHRGVVTEARIDVEPPLPRLVDLMHDTLVGIAYGPTGFREWCGGLIGAAPDRHREIEEIEKWLEEAL